ncbi:MAG: hypothetical protein V3S24_19780 [Candidatus Tectomicrobia bacterium]
MSTRILASRQTSLKGWEISLIIVVAGLVATAVVFGVDDCHHGHHHHCHSRGFGIVARLR